MNLLVWGLGSLLVALALLVFGLQHFTTTLVQEETSALEEQMLSARRNALEHQVTSALGSLSSLYARGGSQAELEQQAKSLLKGIRYGEHGYVFVYDRDGGCVVHTAMPELVGRKFSELGPRQQIVGPLLELARKGGGFSRYRWPKPGSRQDSDKLSYVALFKPWGWTIGTGDYLDDIERATRALKERESSAVRIGLWSVGLIGAVSVCLAFGGAMALYVAERRRTEARLITLNQRTLEAREEERARISRLLHDEVAQTFCGAKLQVEAARNQILASGTGALSNLETGLLGLAAGLREMRELSHDIRPPDLDDLGLGLALKAHVEEFARRTGISVSFETFGPIASLPGPASVDLFRIAQESLINVERHAEAKDAEVSLSVAADKVHLSVVDHGRGLQKERLSKASGIGLLSIRERAKHLGGVLRIESRPGETSISVTLPLRPGANA